MTNIHEYIDLGTIQVSALLLRDAKFFARSLNSRPLTEVASESEASVAGLSRAGEQTATVETPIGTFEAAYMPWQWRGPDYPEDGRSGPVFLVCSGVTGHTTNTEAPFHTRR